MVCKNESDKQPRPLTVSDNKISIIILNSKIFKGITKFLGCINRIKLLNLEISYELSFEPNKNLRYLNIDEILGYFNQNYINANEVNKERLTKNLAKDLITFKTYRDDIEIRLKGRELITGFLSTAATVISILIAFLTDAIDYVKGEDLKLITENVSWLLTIVIFMMAGYFILVLYNYYRNSNANKLKIVNNLIYNLEALKDEMVEENKILNADESKDCKGLNKTSSDKPNVNRRKAKDKNKSNKNQKIK
ncbi:hypothetical protein [Peptoniphilus grossensis]|uniref:hypothetical protein n=1 Tax=Peptoniphilus grossensis TaxID=1465756 RepID=UPI00399574A2